MRVIKIASENTDRLQTLDFQINQTKASYERDKQTLDNQYLRRISQMEQERTRLIAEIQREEQIQLNIIRQMNPQNQVTPQVNTVTLPAQPQPAQTQPAQAQPAQAAV